MRPEKTNYVPLIVQYSPSIISIDSSLDIEAVYEEYVLLITSVASSNLDVVNVLPQKYSVRVEEGTAVKLKLFVHESIRNKPHSRYEVKIYSGTDGKILGKQTWLVPHIQLTRRRLEIDYTEPYLLPKDLFSIESISPEVNYVINNNRLELEDEGKYFIEYLPGLTLYDVVIQD